MRNAHPHTAKIRRRRIIYFELGLILALSSMLWAFNLNFEPGIDLMPTEVDPFEKEWDSLVIVNIEEDMLKKVEKLNKPIPKPNDLFKQVDNETPVLEPETNPNETLGNTDDYNKLIANLPVQVGPDDIVDNSVYLVPGVNPQFPGGESALFLYIRKNTVYPPLAKENNIQGKVVVSFVVEKDGSITQIKVEENPGFGLGEEAVRVVKSMPKWTPGEQNFRPVRVQIRIPFKFKLD